MTESEQLLQRFRLLPETGELFDTLRSRIVRPIAGKNGYGRVYVGKREYLAHRVVWLLHTGRWPELEIDHINGKRNDNRIENLRESTSRQNSQNQKARSDCTSGLKGAHFHKASGRFHSKICVSGKYISLGYFDTAESAHAAYAKAAKELFGEFARAT